MQNMIYVIDVCEVLIHVMATPTIFRLQTATLPTAKKKQKKTTAKNNNLSNYYSAVVPSS